MNMVTSIEGEREYSLGQAIKQARVARGWTLEKLATEVGVSKVTVWTWENERCRPRHATLQRLGAALDVPAETLAAGGALEPSFADLIAECRVRIARAAGVNDWDVEIRVTFPRGQG